MHFEILVEDQSGKKMLDILVPRIIGDGHTVKIHGYKGLGRIPKNLAPKTNANKRILLDQLPRLLRGYGRAHSENLPANPAAVIVVCDLDDNCLKAFRQNLFAVLNSCDPKPETRFCMAIEEGEAWLLGDIPAIQSVYPRAKDSVLNGYENVTTRPPLLRPGLGIGAPTGGCVGARHASPVWRGPRNVCIWRLGSPNVRAAHAPPLRPVGA